ncbi:uncharacterized protein LOC122020017 [Zingiber officinale]|uniref:uncharacterized protein LOC122020017 n=1 Tax=Zingiber officinale TaxID=94328 RepID=UPI001C4A97A5|nr:uncharacterized protein LOC122020017 [Zingiber officinale]XP_042433649.1 uncharacterized protein LOC122020017 [Zingiber officinale]
MNLNMLTVHQVRSFQNHWIDGNTKTYVPHNMGSSSQHTYNSNSIRPFQHPLDISCIQRFRMLSSIKSHRCRTRIIHHCRSPNEGVRKNLLCHWDSNASSDQDYRSSRNIAISLFKRYRNVIDRGSGDNLKEFISAGVNAYALGCTDEGLRQELINIKDSGAEVEGLQTDYGGTTVKLEIVTKEVNECILWLSIVFITILCAPPPTVVRWSSTPPVSAETMHQWKGFCAIIANAYYVRGMAWLPVKTLQLEQMAVTGSAEEPSLVASRMRITFSTLEVVSPQWPRA